MSQIIHIPDIYSDTNSNLENNISRRTFLRYGSATVIGASIAPLTLWIPKADAAAPFWLFGIGKGAASAAIGWLVKQLLERYVAPHLDSLFDLFDDRKYRDFETNPHTADRLAKKLRIKEVNPKPTNNAFHNRYASPYAIKDRVYHFNSTYSKKCCAFMELNHYLRLGKERQIPDFTDLSIDEIKVIAYIEQKCRIMLIPSGKRTPISGIRNGVQQKYTRRFTHQNRKFRLDMPESQKKGKLQFCVNEV